MKGPTRVELDVVVRRNLRKKAAQQEKLKGEPECPFAAHATGGGSAGRDSGQTGVRRCRGRGQSGTKTNTKGIGSNGTGGMEEQGGRESTAKKAGRVFRECSQAGSLPMQRK